MPLASLTQPGWMHLDLYFFLILGSGLLAGGVLTSLYARGRRGQALEQLRSQVAAEQATLCERLSARDLQIVGLQNQLTERQQRLDALQSSLSQAQSRTAELEARNEEQRRSLEERLAQLRDVEARLGDAFKALSAKALESNNQMFMDLARNVFARLQEGASHDLARRQQSIAEMVAPIRESLTRVDEKINALENARTGAYQGLVSQVQSLLESQNTLRLETANLVKALRSPTTRGRWGEIQLKRVVELAGMLDHCDFYEQPTVSTEDGGKRPDMVIRLPGDKHVVVDAKAPLSAYLEAIDETDERVRAEKMRHYAVNVKRHIQALGQKSYWEQFKPAPEFVVLFIPGEPFFAAALEQDPSLIEVGVEQRVIIATPTTLIALLRAVAYGWRQESMTRNAEEVAALGRQLYKRLSDFASHVSDVGRHLRSTVNSYNKTIGSLESRVLVTARRFQELNVEGAERAPADTEPLDIVPRQFQSAELIGAIADDGVI